MSRISATATAKANPAVRRTGIAMSRLAPDAAPPRDIEEARWLFIHDGADGCRFIRLGATTADAIAREFVANRCTDVIAHDLGGSALEAAGIRVWHAAPRPPRARS